MNASSSLSSSLSLSSMLVVVLVVTAEIHLTIAVIGNRVLLIHKLLDIGLILHFLCHHVIHVELDKGQQAQPAVVC
jgi:hypothetical protein